MRSIRTSSALALALALALAASGAACSEPDPAPAGASGGAQALAVDPALLWLTDENDSVDDSYAGLTVSVKGTFPDDFRLDLAGPPPAEAYFKAKSFLEIVGSSGIKVAMGIIVAVRDGQLSGTPKTIPAAMLGDADFLRGQVEDWNILYLDQDLPAGPVADALFGGKPMGAGYHLLSTKDDVEAPGGLDTPLRLTLAPPK